MNIINNLKKRGFKPFSVSSTTEILNILKQNIPYGAEIGFGGSMTLEELEIPQKLKNEGYVCNHSSVSDKSWETLCRDNRYVDYYITSTNALTKDGELVNTDGRANRISAMCYGPKKLFFILGTNKICDSILDAFNRIETTAAPLNAGRLNKKTPCTNNDKCLKCNVNETICKATLILHHPTSSMEVYVIIINKELGY